MVVGVADLVLIAVGKLALDPVAVVTAPVKLGAEQVAEAMAGLAILVAERLQRQIHGVLAHGPAGVVSAGEHQRVLAGDLVELAQDGHGLAGEGNDVRAARLHPLLGDGPGRSIKVELGPGRGAQLAWANGRQGQQLDGASGQDVDLGRLDLVEQLGELGEGNVRMVLGRWRLSGDHIQIGGRVVIDGALSQTVAKDLIQPLAGFLGDVVRAALSFW